MFCSTEEECTKATEIMTTITVKQCDEIHSKRLQHNRQIDGQSIE